MTHTGKSDLVDLKYGIIVHETPMAFLFEFEHEKPHVWIPKSQCEVDEHTMVVTMKQSLAEDKEIEGYVV